MGLFIRHPKISAAIVFTLLVLLPAIDAIWDLYDKIRGEAYMSHINLGIGIWLLPLVGVILAVGIIWQGRRLSKSRNNDIDNSLVNVRLDLVKLLHDGKDIQAKLKRVQTGSIDHVSAGLHFEVWLTDVSNTLKDTEFQILWYESKIVDYRKHKLSDYIEASERALERLESILQLVSDKKGSLN